VAKLLIEKGVFTKAEFMDKTKAEVQTLKSKSSGNRAGLEGALARGRMTPAFHWIANISRQLS